MSDVIKTCEWFVGRQYQKCDKKAINNEDYCNKHLYVKDYANEQRLKKKYCSSCRKVKCFSDDSKTCGCALERVTESNAKKKQKNDIQNDEKNKKAIDDALEESRLILEDGYIKCFKCNKARPPNSFIGVKGNTSHCEKCRTAQKESDAKRTTKRDWSTEYKNNPELYKRKVEYNKNNINYSEYQKNYKERLKNKDEK